MTVLLLVTAVFGLCALVTELRRSLMMYQQNGYRPDRYRNWLKESADSTSPRRLCGMAVFLIVLTPFFPLLPGVAVMGAFFIFSFFSLFRKKYKKPLVMTSRAMRIFITSLVTVALIAAIGVLCFAARNFDSILFIVCEAVLMCICASHMIIVFADFVLRPVEKRITNGYIEDARRILKQMPDLKIIGITGSYGKTSTKHFLHRILSESYETVMTPGNYNTTLGVVRTVRELLKPYHEVFIVEMGAKQLDDIADICRLVHPHKGIITAVGPQHLESFKTIEAVQSTKFELADALPADGPVLVNNDFEKIADRVVENTVCKRYAINNTEGADYIATDIVYTPRGTDFAVIDTATGHRLDLHTRLMGEPNISDLLAAVAMAWNIGVSDDKIARAVSQIEPVLHRLSSKTLPGGLTIIDDAYNSNPAGSSMALDVLAGISPEGRVLVTPGMVELGEQQYELNEKFGFKAASCADLVIVVGQCNREAITEGLHRGGMPDDKVLIADTFEQAQQLLAAQGAAVRVILYENDLPDTYK